MVTHALDAFVRLDPTLSHDVLNHDDVVDKQNRELIRAFTEQMKDGSLEIEAGIEVLSMVKGLERLADHATNIAEEVIFIVTGDDIRHGRRKSV